MSHENKQQAVIYYSNINVWFNTTNKTTRNAEPLRHPALLTHLHTCTGHFLIEVLPKSDFAKQNLLPVVLITSTLHLQF